MPTIFRLAPGRGRARCGKRCGTTAQTGHYGRNNTSAFMTRRKLRLFRSAHKSRAGWRIVGIPDAIILALREHLAAFVKDELSALVFPGQTGGPLRRGNFNKMSGWPPAVRAIGREGLHLHDLRNAGNHLAAASGAGLKDLMARMGHDSERAALIYQHQARGADRRITEAIDVHVQTEHGKGHDEGGAAGTLVPAG
jgi:integrase